MKQKLLMAVFFIAFILYGYSQEPEISQTGNPCGSPCTFQVCEVPLAKDLLQEVSYQQALKIQIGTDLESYPNISKNLVPSSMHPFMETLMQAFDTHRAIILSPDMIWLLICQGFAQHVNIHAEELRHKFVKHQGKETISVRRDDFTKGKLDNPWQEVFPEFTAGIRKHVGDELHDLVIAHFSTTGELEKAAFEVTLMDAMKKYFSYMFTTLCGIPSVTLEGTKADWELLIAKVQSLRQYELDWWIDELLPVLGQFAAAMDGKVDKTFWSGIFKYIPSGRGSGAFPSINGWCIKLFPYLSHERKNPYLSQPPDEKRGLDFGDIPSGLSKVEFIWKYFNKEFPMEFLAGFVGISQNRETMALRPEIGWAVRDGSSK